MKNGNVHTRRNRNHITSINTIRGTAFGLLVIMINMLLPAGVMGQMLQPVPGIDCNCSTTGNYAAQHFGVIPEVQIETVSEGTSPNEIYRIVTGPGVINIYENEPGGGLVLRIEGIPDGAGWGFSPDDHRFVYHYISAGQQTLELYDLRQGPGHMVGDISRTLLTGESSRIRFSPNGIYLFYLAVKPDGENDAVVMDTTGTVAHSSTFAHDQGVGLEGETFHNSTWAFSRDDHDRTFVYAWTTGGNSVRKRVVNLTDREVVTDLSLPVVFSSFWRFSRCGDVMALYIQDALTVSPQNPFPVRIRLIRTRDGHSLYNETFSTIDYTVFSCNESHHMVTFGQQDPLILAPNTAGDACATEPEPVVELESLTITPATVTGGAPVDATLTITEPAPEGGYPVTLTSNRSEATLPSEITIPAGQTSANFEIQTGPVSETVTATITATANGTVRSRSFSIRPPRLIATWLDPDSVYSGNSSVLYLELDGEVPESGVTIFLESDAGDEVDLPDSTTIWWGNTGSVRLATRGIAEPVNIVIQATLDVTLSATLHIMPAELQTISYDFEIFSPCVLRWSDNQAIGGRVIGYRVELNGEAPPAGATISLTSSNPSIVTPPAEVTIDGRERSALFQVSTTPVESTQSVPFQAYYRQKIIERSLTTVKPPLQYYVQELKVPGYNQTSPVSINNVGQTLVISTYDHDTFHYYLLENGEYTRQLFSVPDGMRLGIFDFNDRGQYAGVYQEIIERRGAAVWENGIRYPLRIPYDADPATLHIAAINNKGQVAGNYVNRDNHRAVVRWNNGQPVELSHARDLLAPHYILITNDINENGRVAASGWRHSSQFQLPPFIAAVFDRIDHFYFPRAYGTWPVGTYTNNHNTWTGGNTQIFWPANGTYTGITPPLQSFQQYPEAINDREEIVGYVQFDYELEGTSIRQAIRVTEEGTWPLECLVVNMEEGITFTNAVDINNAGQILAESHLMDEDENYEFLTWMLTPTDVPHANLRVVKSVDSETVTTGTGLIYTITVTNQGPDVSEGVQLTEAIPPNQKLISVEAGQGTCVITDGTLHCHLGSLNAGSSANIIISTKAIVSGISENHAVAFGHTLELDPESNRAAAVVTVTGGEPVTSSASVDAGETGELDLGDSGVIMDVTEGSSTSGSVSVTMYHEEPENSQDLPVVSVMAPGGPMEADSVLTGRFWTIEPENLEDLTYTLCLNISGLAGVNPDFLVITKRTGSSQQWAVHNSSLRSVDNALYLCTEGLTEFSQLGIATELGTYTTPSEPGPLPPAVTLIEPADGAVIEPDSVVFSWSTNGNGIVQYRFELATDSDFTSIITDTLVNDPFIHIYNLVDHTTWWWRVRAENETGWGPYSAQRHILLTAVATEQLSDIPDQFELRQNFPNPFNPETRIQFALPNASHVRLEIFNILGQKVATLVNDYRNPGWYTINFNATGLSSGVYFYRIEAGVNVETRSMMIVR